MGLLQSLVKNIEAGFGKATPHSVNPAYVVQPGHKVSPAVETQNKMPLTNQYNSQGFPTYEILNNMPSVASFYQRSAPQLRPMGQLSNPTESTPLQAHPLSFGTGMQGRVNDGFVPMQRGGYANRLQTSRNFDQQGLQPGVTSYNIRGLLQ